MKRREFLIGAAAAAGMAATKGAWAQGALGARASQESKLARIAIMTWGFDRVLKKVDDPNNPARTLDIFDVPQMFADRYGVHNVEMQHGHFESTEPAYLKEFRDRLAASRSRLSQINVEFGQLNISAPTNPARVQTIDLTKRWIDHAVALGCPRVMVNQGGLTPEVIPTATATLRTIREYADTRGIRISMENRGANWPPLVELAKATGTFTNVDLGNFPDKANQLAGTRALGPLEGGNAHAKLTLPDLAGAIRVLEGLGYTGLYSIEADPPPADPYAYVQEVKDVLMANI